MKLNKLGSFGLATVMATALFAGSAFAQEYVPRPIEGSSSSSSSNTGSMIFVNTSANSYTGGLYAGLGIGYSTMVWDHKNFKPLKDNNLKRNNKHSFDNAVVTFTAGYNWQYIGLFTDLDFLGGYGAGDFAYESKKDQNDPDTERESQYRDTMIRWHAGPTVHYATDKFMAQLGAGVGLTWVKLSNDTRTTTTRENQTTKTSNSNFFYYEGTQFSFKLDLKLDYFVTNNIGVGLTVGYTFVDLEDDFYLEFQDAKHAHLIDVQLNAVYRF